MATRYQALIRDAAAYDAFKELMPADAALPATYDLWLNIQAEERHNTAAAKNITRPIEVDPEEFARYCRVSGFTCNRVSLDSFLVAKAGGASY